MLCSKQKVVTAKEVLDAGLELGPTMETIIVTVGHLALHSDAMELEVSVHLNSFVSNRLSWGYFLSGYLFFIILNLSSPVSISLWVELVRIRS